MVNYAETVIIHRDGYEPAGPPTEFSRETRPIDAQSTVVQRTLIRYDLDQGPVPAGTTDELDRWVVNVPAGQANRREIMRLSSNARTDLQAVLDTTGADLSAMTETERWAWVLSTFKLMARALRRIIRIMVNDLSGTD